MTASNRRIKGTVEETWMVGGRDDDAIGVIVFDELQEGIQHAPNLTDFIARGSIRSERIELVEQVHRARLADGVENEPQLGGRLTKVFRDQAVQLNAEEGQAQLREQIAALTAQAAASDAAEDAAQGPDVRGDELPAELRRREERLAKIAAAKARLEARQAEEERIGRRGARQKARLREGREGLPR